MLIRKIQDVDKEKVFSILESEMGREYLEEMLQEWGKALNNEVNAFVVVEEDGNISGYAVLEKKVQIYYINTIAVNKNSQGKGIGTNLIYYLKEEVKRKGANILNVITDADAQRTIQFYLKQGFEISGYVSNEFIPNVAQVHLYIRIK